MNDEKISILKRFLSTILIIFLWLKEISLKCLFYGDKPISKDSKLIPSGEVVELCVKLKYPLVLKKLNKNSKFKKSDILISITLNDTKITPNRKNIEKLMKSKKLPLSVICYRNDKIKSINITSDDLRDFEFGYYLCYLGTMTAYDVEGNFVALAHDLKDRKMPFEFLDNAIYNTSYVQTCKNTLFHTGYLVTSSAGERIGKFTGTGDGGIYGKLENYIYNNNLSLETSTPKEGKAYLYCTSPVSNELKMHEIEILEVGKEVSQIKVIDKDLLKYRGGIVQGMSGTPIIQDNKIVGGARAVVKANKTIGVMSNIHYMIKNSNR